MDEATRARRLAAKRNNERVKLFAGALNALAVGVIAAAVIIPGVASVRALLDLERAAWFGLAIALHSMAQAAFGLLHSED